MRHSLTDIACGSLFIVFGALAGCSGDDLTVPPTAGTLAVTTATTGAEPDPDGYLVQVDAASPLAIGASATVQTPDLAPGAHLVQLSGIAPNCTVAENPRSVTVVGGEMATVEFALTCGATTGSVQVSAATSGPAPDADGYSLSVDGIDRGPLAAAGSVTLDGLTPGNHEIGLSGIAANCQVQGSNPQTLSVTAGAGASVAFAVVCGAPPASAGTLRIITATSGADPDANGYVLAVDGGSSQPIAVNATATLANVAAGTRSVRLSNLAANCAVQGGNPRAVTLAAGATAEVRFEVACTATSGTIQASVSSSGSPPDPDGFTVQLDGQATGQPVSPSAPATFARVPAGPHAVALSGVAANCVVAGDNPQQVTVAVGAQASVAFTVSCSSPAAQWRAMESGTDFILTGVWGSGPTNVFTVGIASSGAGDAAVFHYDGQAWSRQFAPPSPARLAGVWGSGPNDVFAVGTDLDVSADESQGLIFHYNGSAWSEMTGPDVSRPDAETSVDYASVWGSSPQDVFAVGTYFDLGERSIVAHYDGTGWSKMTVDNEQDRNLVDVSGSSSQDVWAVGVFFPAQGYFIAHYDGQQWTEPVSTDDPAQLTGVWTSSPTDVFAVGNGDAGGFILHYDGTNWSPMTIPPSGGINDIWGTSSSDVYAVGDGILHYDGTSWTKVSAEGSLHDVWGSSSTDIFAVGDGGRIFHATP